MLEVESGAEIELHVRDAGRRADRPGLGRRSGHEPRLHPREPGQRAGGGEGRPAGRRARRRDPRAAPGELGLDRDHPRVRAAGRRIPRPVAAHLLPSTPRRAAWASPTASRCRSSPSRAPSASALPEPGQHSIVPPSTWGGNLDIKHLRVGTTLYLPVGVAGALFSVGDTHAAMGDGEVCGTAVEAAMDIVVRLSIRRDFSVPAPQYAVPAGRPRPHRGRVVTPSRPASARPVRGHPGGHAGDDRPPRPPLRARPAGGLRPVLGGLRPARARGRRRAQLGGGLSLPEAIFGRAAAGE